MASVDITTFWTKGYVVQICKTFSIIWPKLTIYTQFSHCSLTETISQSSAPPAPPIGGQGGAAAVLHVVIVQVTAAAVSLQTVVGGPRPGARLLPVQLQSLGRVSWDYKGCKQEEYNRDTHIYIKHGLLSL